MEEKEKEDEKMKLGEGTSADIPTLKKVVIDNLGWLNSQHKQMEAFSYLQSLDIWFDKEVESLGEAQEVFHICSSSLRCLEIGGCSNLRSISGGLKHLANLKVLAIRCCCNLSILKEGESVDVDDIYSILNQSLSHSLRSLELTNFPQLVNLPSGIQYLTTLQTLEITNCKNLKSLPSWMPKLTSLRELQLRKCPAHLKERCEQSTGEDWPHINHISSIAITDEYL